MKKILFLAVLLPVAIMGCKKYNDSEIKEKLANHEQRIAALESAIASVNSQISAMQSILSAINAGDYINSVTPLADGYIINFAKAAPVTIRNGKDGKDGVDGVDGINGTNGIDGVSPTAPLIGVDEFPAASGVYYWTVSYDNGASFDWILDGTNKIPTTGADGLTPEFSVDAAGYWLISWDGGVTFNPLLDNASQKVLARVSSIPFNLTVNQTDFELVFDFLKPDGTVDYTISIPFVQPFKISIDGVTDFTLIVGENDSRTYTVVVENITSADYLSLSARVIGKAGSAADVHTRAISGWDVELGAYTFDDPNLTATFELIITSPNGITYSTNEPDARLALSLLGTDGRESTAAFAVKTLFQDGSALNPYLIWKLSQLEDLAVSVNGGDNKFGKYYKVIDDIDMTGSDPLSDGFGFVPIGDNANPFCGNLDGNDYTISNLFIDRGGDNNIGLFGYIHTGKVQNLNLENADITGNEKVGSIAGSINGTSSALGIIDNCNVSGNINGTGNIVGGIAGSIGTYGIVSGCIVEGTVSGASYVGGITGHINGLGSNLINCGVKANVSSYTGTGIQIGGIAGEININGNVANCYASGNVSGYNQIGGLVGCVYGGTITNCYSTGDVYGYWRAGGVAGVSFGTITNCYATGVISGAYNIGGVIGSVIIQSASPFQPGFLENCVALNTAITVSNNVIGRVAGDIAGGTTVNNNWAWVDIIEGGVILFTGTFGGSDINGEPVSTLDVEEESWWINIAGWAFGTSDAAPWIWDSTLERPVLYWE